MKKKILLLTAIAIFGLTRITCAQVPSYVPTNGLVGWWPFNGSASDESGNGNNGTVNGATLTSDRFGNSNSAYDFDGISNYIDVGDIDAIENITSATISFWMNPRTSGIQTASGGRPIISKWNSLPGFPNECSFNILLSDTLLRVTFKDNLDTARISDFNSGIALNDWCNVTIVFNPGSVRYFFNGNLIEQNSIPVNQISNSTRAIKFGDWYHTESSNYKTFDGVLDDIGMWNRALTAQEISNLYNGSNVGLNETSQDNLFSVFPNPAQNLINVKAGHELLGEVYTIYDNTGRVFLTGKLNSQNTTIDLSNLSGGTYMFCVGKNMKQSFKVIKE